MRTSIRFTVTQTVCLNNYPSLVRSIQKPWWHGLPMALLDNILNNPTCMQYIAQDTF